jgi:threonine aldolase
MTVNDEFGSDNHSGVHPAIIKAINSVNTGYSVAYGDDFYTQRAVEKFKEHFGKEIDVYFVGNGTAANILGLKVVTSSFNSIFCAETAHLNVHECCGPEKFTGCKLVTIPTPDGKLTVDLIKPHIIGFGDPHMAQPKVISITQSTERGTVYIPEEIKVLSDFAHENNMLLHMDGARLCNAAAYLDLSLNAIAGEVGVDVLSFGGTKNGMMFGDAVIFYDKKLSKNFEFIRKQGMHLTSKMRFISAQFEALLTNDLWLKNAKHANKMAQVLYREIKSIPQIKVTQKVQGNAIFAALQKKIIEKLWKKYAFHIIDEKTEEVRWMCSFNTTREDVLNFVETVKQAIEDN